MEIVEEKIDVLIDGINLKGKNIPKEIWDIPEFPYQLYSELTDGINSGVVRLLRHSRLMESSLFSIIATKKEKAIQLFGQVAFWGTLPLAVVLYFAIGFWSILVAAAAYFLGTKLISSSYNAAIFRSAAQSEIIFCFLYYVGQVSVGLVENKTIYFYEGE